MSSHSESSDDSDASEKFVVQLVVTEEQRLVIEHLFAHNHWTYEECGEREEHGDFDDGPRAPGYIKQQNLNEPECAHCLCRPCITDPSNKQMWWEEEQQPPHARNSSIRKGLYKRFWTMLYHRQVWQDPRYLERKSLVLNQDNLRVHRVWSGGRLHKRDLMPKCVLDLVRSWLPNPPTLDYMGHRWG